MRLPQEFYRLPVRFDAQRLREEIAQLPAGLWAEHPSDYESNTTVRLISVDGGENDEVGGTMRPTPHLARLPYVQQILAGFGVVWSRSRLMRLGPRSVVPEHADINYHWATRVRLHIPVITRPEVLFHCGAASVHMAAGEAWVFDNWRRHRVENPTDEQRIHLVADTSGNAAFWRMVAAGGADAQFVPYQPGLAARILTERDSGQAVMPPGEVQLLLDDLKTEAFSPGEEADAARLRVARFRVLLDDFARDWRQLWALYGDSGEGRDAFTRLCADLRGAAREPGEPLRARTNDVPALKILEGRVLQHAVRAPRRAAPARPAAPAVHFDRPLIIVAAPRSGSTLLYETLSCTPQLANLGGEAHWLVELIDALRPGAPGVDSNRLTAAQCTPAARAAVLQIAAGNLRDASGAPRPAAGAIRLLEKTPKNSLRIPFFEQVFPDARYLFLWRDPRENLGSIIEGWKAGRWITYPQLGGWDGPWSFLLPPGWQALRGRPLEEVAAFQWATTNRVILDDLAALDRSRWMSLDYAGLVADPRAAIERVCAFAGLSLDAELAARVGAPLPLSRFTQTPPEKDKWRRNAAGIDRVLPGVEDVWARLRALQSPKA